MTRPSQFFSLPAGRFVAAGMGERFIRGWESLPIVGRLVISMAVATFELGDELACLLYSFRAQTYLCFPTLWSHFRSSFAELASEDRIAMTGGFRHATAPVLRPCLDVRPGVFGRRRFLGPRSTPPAFGPLTLAG